MRRPHNETNASYSTKQSTHDYTLHYRWSVLH